jgi:hypothetical protein
MGSSLFIMFLNGSSTCASNRRESQLIRKVCTKSLRNIKKYFLEIQHVYLLRFKYKKYYENLTSPSLRLYAKRKTAFMKMILLTLFIYSSLHYIPLPSLTVLYTTRSSVNSLWRLMSFKDLNVYHEPSSSNSQLLWIKIVLSLYKHGVSPSSGIWGSSSDEDVSVGLLGCNSEITSALKVRTVCFSGKLVSTYKSVTTITT